MRRAEIFRILDALFVGICVHLYNIILCLSCPQLAAARLGGDGEGIFGELPVVAVELWQHLFILRSCFCGVAMYVAKTIKSQCMLSGWRAIILIAEYRE